MAEQYYTLEEAAAKLSKSQDEIRTMVRDGVLRQFMDAGKIRFRAADVDRLAQVGKGSSDSLLISATPSPSPSAQSGSFNLEILDEGEESDKSGSGSDVLSLEDIDESPRPSAKDDTVITSVGISVFDDEELEIDADPLAKTEISPAMEDQIPAEGTGSGSGLLDLTRESDDTSLGAELLDEIYPGEEETAVDEGTADDAFTHEVPSAPLPTVMPTASVTGATVALTVPADPLATAFTGLSIIGTIVLVLVGFTAIATTLGVMPAFLAALYSHLLYYVIGVVVIAGIGLGVGLLLGRRASNEAGQEVPAEE
jgi:excisionase family DNA binding protein